MYGREISLIFLFCLGGVMKNLFRSALSLTLASILPFGGVGVIYAQQPRDYRSELTVRQESVSDQIHTQTISTRQHQQFTEAVHKETDKLNADKQTITDYLTCIKEALARESAQTAKSKKAKSKKQTETCKFGSGKSYKELVDELNNLIIIGLSKESTYSTTHHTQLKETAADNDVYRLTVLQDNIVQGTISKEDYVRAKDVLYNKLYEPCKGQECEIRGAAILTLAIAGREAGKYGKDKAFKTKIVQRISGTSKQDYGGLESDKTIGKNAMIALSILPSPTGQRTIVQNYVDKYGKKRRYEPTNPKDAFLIHLTELAVQYPYFNKQVNYATPHLIAEWSNSDNLLLKLRGNIEIGRLPQRNEYFNAKTLDNVRTFLKAEYCKRDRAKPTRNDLMAQNDLALGYFGGRANYDSLRTQGNYSCVVKNPNPGQFEIVTNKEMAQKLATEAILFTIPTGCALAAVAKVAKKAIRVAKLANKTGKPLREVYKTAQAVKKGQKAAAKAVPQAKKEAKAVGELVGQIESGSSALGTKGAKNAVKDMKAAKRAATPEGAIVKDGNQYIYRGSTAPTAPPEGFAPGSGVWQKQIGFGDRPYVWREYAPTGRTATTMPLNGAPKQTSRMAASAGNTPTAAAHGTTPTNMAAGAGNAGHGAPAPMIQTGTSTAGTSATRNPIGFRPQGGTQTPTSFAVTNPAGVKIQAAGAKSVQEAQEMQRLLDEAWTKRTETRRALEQSQRKLEELQAKQNGRWNIFGKNKRQEQIQNLKRTIVQEEREFQRALENYKRTQDAIGYGKPLPEVRGDIIVVAQETAAAQKAGQASTAVSTSAPISTPTPARTTPARTAPSTPAALTPRGAQSAPVASKTSAQRAEEAFAQGHDYYFDRETGKMFENPAHAKKMRELQAKRDAEKAAAAKRAEEEAAAAKRAEETRKAEEARQAEELRKAKEAEEARKAEELRKAKEAEDIVAAKRAEEVRRIESEIAQLQKDKIRDLQYADEKIEKLILERDPEGISNSLNKLFDEGYLPHITTSEFNELEKVAKKRLAAAERYRSVNYKPEARVNVETQFNKAQEQLRTAQKELNDVQTELQYYTREQQEQKASVSALKNKLNSGNYQTRPSIESELRKAETTLKQYEERVTTLNRQLAKSKLTLANASDKVKKIQTELDAIPTLEQYEQLRRELETAEKELKRHINHWQGEAKKVIEYKYDALIEDARRNAVRVAGNG